mmetsp:Transcript_31034/g.71518  ORF Transcript_31034/g.71518 Transcript_31034/m.71518 type:complete len:205 (+) Transcript_31034:402-1016(+)
MFGSRDADRRQFCVVPVLQRQSLRKRVFPHSRDAKPSLCAPHEYPMRRYPNLRRQQIVVVRPWLSWPPFLLASWLVFPQLPSSPLQTNHHQHHHRRLPLEQLVVFWNPRLLLLSWFSSKQQVRSRVSVRLFRFHRKTLVQDMVVLPRELWKEQERNPGHSSSALRPGPSFEHAPCVSNGLPREEWSRRHCLLPREREEHRNPPG